jgi:hypothetical protein
MVFWNFNMLAIPYKTNEMKDKPRDYLCLDVEFMKWSHDTDFSPHGQKKHVHGVPTDLAVEIVNLATF